MAVLSTNRREQHRQAGQAGSGNVSLGHGREEVGVLYSLLIPLGSLNVSKSVDPHLIEVPKPWSGRRVGQSRR